jgi:outer membrane protein insertion porin family
MRKSSASEHTVQHTFYPLFFLLLISILYSCARIKNAPRNQPFVYNTRVKLEAADLKSEERKLMEEKLYEAVDDSLQVSSKQILGFTQRVNPALFDSGNVRRSLGFMNGYLNSVGYYQAVFDTFTVEMKTVQKQKTWPWWKKRQSWTEIRVTTNFYLTLGKKLRVDTLAYQFKSPILQHLADSAKSKTLLRRDDPYSKDAMGAELDRLSAIFRKNGFLKMSRSALLAEADTTDPSLISMSFDPLQQLLEAQKRLEDPRIKLRVFERPNLDTSIFMQFFVDTVFIYPETKITEDPDLLMYDTTFTEILGRRAFLIRQREETFRPNLIRRFNYIRRERLYDEAAYFRTVNNYYKMGPWQQVDVRTTTHMDTVPKANFHIFLYPNKRQNFQIDLEGSQNNNISVSNTLSGRFFALSLNGTLRNRNLFRSAVQSISAVRFGFELNNKSSPNSGLFQSFITTVNQSFSIPRLIWPMTFLDKKRFFDAGRTKINMGAAYVDRFEFYTQVSFNASLEWEWRRGRNNHSFSLPAFESVSISATDSLIKEITTNPSLIYAFTPGNILSTRYAFEHQLVFNRNPRLSGYYRLATELSPFKFEVFNQESFRFVKFEGQYVLNVLKKKTSWNYRVYGGVGWDISGNPTGTLPYFRQYITGGSNSMRAWPLRQLGVGNSLVFDTSGFTDRFADIQIEFNAEYRFRLFRLLGFNFGGAIFADCGNIWAHDNYADGNGKLTLKYFYRDLAFDMGVGVRWDVSYLVIRLDAAYKLKDPVREGDGWLKQLEWKTSNRIGSPPKNNVGFQFGIGYPF